MSIYMHLKTSTFLGDKFKEKKDKNPSFSIRAWSNQMGLNSHGSFQQILAGKRTVPKKYIPNISKSLELSKLETKYFETLVDLEKSKTEDEKNIYYARLNELRPSKKKVNILEIENYKYFQNPLHSILRTLIERKDFVYNLKWIKEKLRIKTTQKEIAEVLSRLIKLGFVKKDQEKLSISKDIIRNKIDTPSKAVQSFHYRMSNVAAQEVLKQSVEDREYNSFCFNMKKGQIESAKERIRDFSEKFISEFSDQGKKSTETYHINIQLFSLTRKTGEKK